MGAPLPIAARAIAQTAARTTKRTIGEALRNTVAGALLVTAAGTSVAGAVGPAVADNARSPVASGAERAAVRVLSQGTAHDALYDVTFEGPDGVAVGGFGKILATGDGGLTWNRIASVPGGQALFGVTRSNGRCVAVGQQGTVFRSDDCRKWRVVPPYTRARLMAVGMNRHGLAIAVGAFGQVAMSGDWGATWSLVPVDWSRIVADGVEPHLYAVDVSDDGRVTVAGEFELVLRLQDGRWNVMHKGERTLFGLRLLGNGTGYAVGQSGAVLVTPDGGATWRPLDSGTQTILTGVAATVDGQVIATGINAIVTSDDSGKTWRMQSSPLVRNAWHQAAGISDAGSGTRRLITVGAGGLILQVNN